MTKTEFIETLKELMEIDDLSMEQNFSELEEFDSLAVMSIVALAFSKFKVHLSGQEISKTESPAALIRLIGEEKFN